MNVCDLVAIRESQKKKEIFLEIIFAWQTAVMAKLITNYFISLLSGLLSVCLGTYTRSSWRLTHSLGKSNAYMFT